MLFALFFFWSSHRLTHTLCRAPFLPVSWLRDHEKEMESRPKGQKREFKYLSNNGWGSGRSNLTIKLSSNAVWRC